MPFSHLLAFVALLALALAGSPNEWARNRRIYQVVTDRFAAPINNYAPKCQSLEVGYCGGTFNGLKNHLDYLKWLGFNAVWISPHVDQTPTNAYHGYHGRDFYKVNHHFGSESDLKRLIDAAHDRDIFVMADLVANHVGPVNEMQGVPPGKEINYDIINPFNEFSDYHPYCEITDWNDLDMVERCRISGLPDFDHSNERTAEKLTTWGSWVMREHGFDGVRLDTVLEVPKEFWGRFTSALKEGARARGDETYVIGEAFQGDVSIVAKYSDVMDGLLAYPVFFSVRNIIGSGADMWDLRSMLETYREYMPSAQMSGLFIGNHDNDRFPLVSGHSEMRQIAAFVWQFTYEGIPMHYYGDELLMDGALAHNTNREVFWVDGFRRAAERPRSVMVIKRLNALLDTVDFDYAPRYGWTDHNLLSYHRGEVLVVLNNVGDVPSSTLEISMPRASHPYDIGQRLCNILDLDEGWDTYCVNVTSDGTLNLKLIGGTSLVLLPVERLDGVRAALEEQEKYASFENW